MRLNFATFSYCSGLKLLFIFSLLCFCALFFMTNPMPHSEVFTENDWKFVQLGLALF